MRESGDILNIERSLGFKWELGLSRKTKESGQIPVLKSFLDEIDVLRKEYIAILPKELRKDIAFLRSCEQLFTFFGPKLWPPSPADTTGWLVDSSKNNWSGLWTRNLTYDTDQEKLRSLFESLIYTKVVTYHINKRQARKRLYRAKVDRLETTEEDVLNHLRGPQNSDGGDENAHTGSTYARLPNNDNSCAPVAPVARMCTNTISRMGPPPANNTSSSPISQPPRDFRPGGLVVVMNIEPRRLAALLGEATTAQNKRTVEALAPVLPRSNSVLPHSKDPATRMLKAVPSQGARACESHIPYPEIHPILPNPVDPTIKAATLEPRPKTVLEKADALIFWGPNDDIPDILDLERCKTHTDLFTQIGSLLPDELEDHMIEAVTVRLANADVARLIASPDCRIPVSNGQKAFAYFLEACGQYAWGVEPRLNVTVQFWKKTE